jgi:hypothetical protein
MEWIDCLYRSLAAGSANLILETHWKSGCASKYHRRRGPIQGRRNSMPFLRVIFLWLALFPCLVPLAPQLQGECK